MGAHLIDGEFQSDKYPSTPRGKVPLSCKDKTAQDLLWEYAQRRRAVDEEFSADLEQALKLQGYQPKPKFRNPVPVAVLLVPVAVASLLVVRRGIEPEKGKLALPGGYVNFGESWEEAALRELWEETGVDLRGDQVKLVGIRKASNGNMIVFGCTRFLQESKLPPFVPNEEVQERVLLHRREPLAFPTHTEMAGKFFDLPASFG